MTQSQIHYFLVAAREGSITRAANRLFVSQPAISKSIAAMEQELGFQIFNRNGNSISLTYAGDQLYEFFSRTTKEYQQLIKSITQYIGNTPTLLKVGCPTTWNPEMFQGKIEEYLSKHHPGVEMSLIGAAPNDLIAMVKSGQLDILLTIAPYDIGHIGLKSVQVDSCGCGLLYSKKHFKHVTSVKDLAQSSLLLYESGIQNRFETMIQQIFKGTYVFKTRFCGDSNTAIFEMSRGNGILFLTNWAFAVRSDQFGFLKLQKDLPVWALYSEETAHPYAETIAKGLHKAFGRGK